MICRRERRLRRVCLFSLPVLVVAAIGVTTWRSADNYLQQTEFWVRSAVSEARYAGAVWRVTSVRVFVDGSDTEAQPRRKARLVTITMSAAVAENENLDWLACNITLVDRDARRWRPLDANLARNIRQELNTSTEIPYGCEAVPSEPGVRGGELQFEQMFVVPAEIIPSLAVRVSVAAALPASIELPLSEPKG